MLRPEPMRNRWVQVLTYTLPMMKPRWFGKGTTAGGRSRRSILKVAPKYIVDLVNTSNENSLGLVLQGQEDLNNNYLPSVSSLLGGGYALHTYYPAAPYHLAANTAWLDVNLQKKPMDDVEFRKALAYSINVADIVSRDYGDMVQAANPTGLLPIWDKYVDQDVVDKLGISYDLAKAKTDPRCCRIQGRQ